MYIWLLVLVLVFGMGGIGYALGSIRSGASFLGAILGLALAGPFGTLIAPLFPKMGTQHPVWLFCLPPLVAFAVVWLILLGAGFALDRPVGLHFKYRTDDATRKGYEALSQAGGLFIGLLTGVILLFAVGKRAVVAGYLTSQTSAEAEPFPISILNQVRSDMRSAGWDKTFAALDKTPKSFYEIADILGLLFHNPLIHGRAANYPPFLSLAEKPEFKEIGADNDLLNQLSTGAGFMALTGNPKIQAVVSNAEVTSVLLGTDLKDFRTYLETAKSPKYDDEKILGRWRLDAFSTLNGTKRSRLDMTSAELQLFNQFLTNALVHATVTAFVDGKLALRVPAPPAPAKKDENANPEGAGAPAGPGGPGFADPTLTQRYGIRPGGMRPGGIGMGIGAPQQPGAVAPKRVTKPAPPNPYAKLELSREGTWKRSANTYVIATTGGGESTPIEANINDLGRLVIPLAQPKIQLHFVRVL